MYSKGKYTIDFHAVASQFSDLVGQEAAEEWAKSCGLYSETIDYDKLNILEFIKYFNISKEDFKAANTPPPGYEDYAVYTDEQIDALYSNDKVLLAQHFMNPNAINVDGEIYPPIWFADCSLAEIQAAGITKEVLEEKYEDWVFAFSEQSSMCQNTKEILDAWNEEISEETTGTDTTLTE